VDADGVGGVIGAADTGKPSGNSGSRCPACRAGHGRAAGNPRNM